MAARDRRLLGRRARVHRPRSSGTATRASRTRCARPRPSGGAREERLQQEQERRVVEAKRRFGALELELTRLKASIERTKREQHNYKHFFPDLPTGSWAAASGPLGVIVSDYELMADLATFYGHVEELRWRLRFKAEPRSTRRSSTRSSPRSSARWPTRSTSLLEQVREQIVNPQVEQIVGAPQAPRGRRRRRAHAAVHRRDPRPDAGGDREGARGAEPARARGRARTRRRLGVSRRAVSRVRGFRSKLGAYRRRGGSSNAGQAGLDIRNHDDRALHDRARQPRRRDGACRRSRRTWARR